MLLRLMLLSAALVAAGGLIAGCSGTSILVLDAGPGDDAGTVSTGRIVLDGESAIGLAPGSEATFRARWIGPDDQPVRGGAVSFGLEGSPGDSTLRAIGAITGSDGSVEGTLLAGTMPGTFRVRITAPGASPAHLDVAVGAEGFGRILVDVRGGDGREIATRRASLTLDVTCEEALARPEGDRARDVPEGESMVEFVALPAMQVFTVVATGTSASGVVVASGCVERVEVTADVSIRAIVELEARPLTAAGEHRATIALASGDIGPSAALALSAAAIASTAEAGGDEALLLDALDRELRDRGHDEAADALAADRASGEPDRALAGALEMEGAGPSRALAALLEGLAPSLAAITVEGTLAIGGDTGGAGASFARDLVIVAGPEGERVAIDLAALGVEPRQQAMVRWAPAGDSLEVIALPIALPIGTLVLGAIDGLARARGAFDSSALVMMGSGCGALGAVIEARPLVRDACDATCVLDVCRAAASIALEGTAVAVTELDARRRDVALAGTLMCTDANGDLRVDAMSAPVLTGTWASADGTGSEPIAASFEASRLAVLP